MFKKPKSIKGRWITNGIVVVATVVVLAVFAFSITISSYYYSSMQTGLEQKAKTASEFFTTYVSNTRAEYNTSIHSYTASFEEKDKLELQFVNTLGKVQVSTHGLTAGTTPGTPDIQNALDSGEITSWTGRRAETGERIMAVSSPLISLDGQVVGVMRYVTSLKLVDHQVLQSVAMAIIVATVVGLLVVFSNLFFINTIIEPIKELTDTAKSIAEGGYGIQAEKKYDDEIGELIDTINEMSTKINKAEMVQTEFISSVSHELRTPLTAITGWSETISYDEAIQGDSRRGITIISKEANRLTKMVEELLEFTRIQDGRFNLAITSTDIAAELDELVYAYRELLAQDNNVELVYKPYEGEIPMIPADPERLRQVFLNVMDNAAKYAGEEKKIFITTNVDQAHIIITVRDYGPGIPEDELPHIKKMFYKGSGKARGSGIGLAVCDEIVSLHNGELDISNAKEGSGLQVTITLPVGNKQIL